jgi:F0F1-type ATP synthase membrane subunit b/b'
MDTSDGKIKDIWGRKFKIVKNGLDEGEVFSFIGGLIDQNNDLSNKLQHLDSLKKLAERTVIEAEKQAEVIRKEIEEKANTKAASIVSKAEKDAKVEADRIISEVKQKVEQDAQVKITAAIQQGQNLIKEAEEKGEALKNSANQEASKIIAEAKQNSSAIEQQAQDVLKKAEEKAETIKANADKKAAKILADAKEKAEDLVKAKTASAEKEALSILEEARIKAEKESVLIKQKSEMLLKKSKKIAESEIKEKFKKVYQGFISSLEGIDETSIEMAISEEVANAEFSKAEATASAQAEVITRESQDQPSLRYVERETKEGPVDLYQGDIELVIPPPLSLDRMLQLHKHLRNTPQIEVLNLGVAADKSITIRILLENPVPLLNILEGLPEVDKALDSPQDAEAIAAIRKSGEKPPAKRIIVTTKTN